MKKWMGLGLKGLILSGLLLSLVGCGGNKSGNTGVVRIGSNRAIGTVTPYLAEELGFFDDKDYKTEVIEFTDGATLMEAMAAGELDLGIVGVSPVATWNAKGLDVRIVASANGGGHVILSTKEKGIKDVSDLKGKIMAGPNPGTVTDTLLKAYILPPYSMTGEDITLITGMSGADMVTNLVSSDELDAIMTWEPYASMAELEYSDVVVVYDAAEEWRAETQKDELYPVNVVAATGEFCENNSEVLKDILSVIKDTVDYVEDNQEEAYEKIGEILGLDTEVVEKASERSQLTFEIDEDATLKTLEWAYQLGYLQEIPEPDDIFDLEYLPEE